MSVSSTHEIGIVHYPGAQVACILGLTDFFAIASTIALDQGRSGRTAIRVTHWKPIDRAGLGPHAAASREIRRAKSRSGAPARRGRAGRWRPQAVQPLFASPSTELAAAPAHARADRSAASSAPPGPSSASIHVGYPPRRRPSRTFSHDRANWIPGTRELPVVQGRRTFRRSRQALRNNGRRANVAETSRSAAAGSREGGRGRLDCQGERRDHWGLGL
jgi:hypothetical protein